MKTFFRQEKIARFIIWNEYTKNLKTYTHKQEREEKKYTARVGVPPSLPKSKKI